MEKNLENKLLDDLTCDGYGFLYRAIITCAVLKPKSPDIISALKKLKDDQHLIIGHPLSEYVNAALDVIGVEKYTGNDSFMKELITTRFEWFRDLVENEVENGDYKT